MSPFHDSVFRKNSMVTKRDIVDGLNELGLKAGDTVVVHSALSSFGERPQCAGRGPVRALSARGSPDPPPRSAAVAG